MREARDDVAGPLGAGPRAALLLLDHQGPAGGVGAAGRLRPQPPQGAPPGGADLARRARLHARRSRCSTRRTTCTRTTRPGIAYEHVPLGRHDELADRLPRDLRHARRAGSTIPTGARARAPRGVRRPPARRARRLPALRGPRRPRARTRSRHREASPAASSARSAARSSRSRVDGAHRRGPRRRPRGADRWAPIVDRGAARARRARRAPRGAGAAAAVRGRRRARGRPRRGRRRATTSTTPSTTPRSSRGGRAGSSTTSATSCSSGSPTRIAEVCRADERVTGVRSRCASCTRRCARMLDHVARPHPSGDRRRRGARTSGSARTSATGSRTCSSRSTASRRAAASRSSRCRRCTRPTPVGGPSRTTTSTRSSRVDTDLTPRELLARRASGSRPAASGSATERWGPRTLDVDVLWSATIAVDDPDLVVPHPRMAERAFVLAPLADLDPELARDPGRRWEGVRPAPVTLRLPE